MILLDTNVISELWKPLPDPHVLAWVDAQVVDTLYLSAITVAELRFGIAAIPAGKRRETLDRRLGAGSAAFVCQPRSAVRLASLAGFCRVDGGGEGRG